MGGALVAGLYFVLGAMSNPESPRAADVIGFGVAGAVVGYGLFLTRAWKSKAPAHRLLRWVLGGAVAGLLLALTGLFDNSITPLSVSLGASLGAFFTLGFGMQSLRDEYVASGEDDRTGREKAAVWALVLTVAFITFALLMLATSTA